MENNHKKSKTIVTIILAIITFTIIGFSYAYFQGQIGAGATANVNVISKTTDVLTFSKGNDISFTITQANFGSGAGNRTGSTTATATLLANNDTNSATQTYNVYFKIENNAFVYSTAPTNTPELLLTVTNPSGSAVTSISGLTYTTVNGISGFDITNKRGLFKIASNYSITSSSSSTATNQTWNITVTCINLSSDQQANAGKFFAGKIIIQKNAITTYYWNDDYVGVYYYSYPLGQKRHYSNQTWVSGTPNISTNMYDFLADSDYAVYIKTTNRHEACFFRLKEFCIGNNYWAGTIGVNSAEASVKTKEKLQKEMEATFGSNGVSCSSFNNSSAYCHYDDYGCTVKSDGVSYCYERNDYVNCYAEADGSADCEED